jgi:hypothetical protein
MGEGACVCDEPFLQSFICPHFSSSSLLILSILRFRWLPTFHSSVCLQGIQG